MGKKGSKKFSREPYHQANSAWGGIQVIIELNFIVEIIINFSIINSH